MFTFDELKELCAEQAQTIIDLANEVRELQQNGVECSPSQRETFSEEERTTMARKSFQISSSAEGQKKETAADGGASKHHFTYNHHGSQSDPRSRKQQVEIDHRRGDVTLYQPFDTRNGREKEKIAEPNSEPSDKACESTLSGAQNTSRGVKSESEKTINSGSKSSPPRLIPCQKPGPRGEAFSSNESEELLSSAYREICEAKDFIDQLQRRLKHLTTSKNDDSERIEDLVCQLEVLKKSNAALLITANTAEEEVKSLKVRLDGFSAHADLEERLEDEKRQNAASMLLYQQELDGLTTENSALRKTVSLLQGEEKSLKAIISDRERSIEKEAWSRREIQQQLQSTKKALDSVLSDNADLKIRLDKEQKKTNNLGKENDEMNKKCDELDEDVLRLRAFKAHWEEAESTKKGNEALLESVRNLVEEISCHVAVLARKQKQSVGEHVREKSGKVVEKLNSRLDGLVQLAREEFDTVTKAKALERETDGGKGTCSGLQDRLDAVTKAHGALLRRITDELSAMQRDRPRELEKAEKKEDVEDEDIDELKGTQRALRRLQEKLKSTNSASELDRPVTDSEVQKDAERDKILVAYLRKELQKSTDKCMLLQKQRIEECNGKIDLKMSPSTKAWNHPNEREHDNVRLVAEIRNQKEVLQRTVEYQKGVIARTEDSKRWLQRTNDDLLMKLRETEQTRIKDEGIIDNLKFWLEKSKSETETVRNELKSCQELVVDSSSGRSSLQTQGASVLDEFESITQLRKELDLKKGEVSALRTQLREESEIASKLNASFERKMEWLNGQMDAYLSGEFDDADLYNERKAKGRMLQAASKLQWELSRKDETIERLQRSRESLRRRLEKSHDDLTVQEERVADLIKEVSRLVRQLTTRKQSPSIMTKPASNNMRVTQEGLKSRNASSLSPLEHMTSNAVAKKGIAHTEIEDDDEYTEASISSFRKENRVKRKLLPEKAANTSSKQRKVIGPHRDSRIGQGGPGIPAKRGRGRPRKQNPFVVVRRAPVKGDGGGKLEGTRKGAEIPIKRGNNRGPPRKDPAPSTTTPRSAGEQDRKPPPKCEGGEVLPMAHKLTAALPKRNSDSPGSGGGGLSRRAPVKGDG